MERYIFAVKGLSISGLVFGGLHLGAHGYVSAEQSALEYFAKTRDAAIDDIATANNYEKKKDDLTLRELAEREALRHGINPGLVKAQMKVESNYNQEAQSPVGAVGAMQVMPFNAKRCGLKREELLDSEKNIRCGVQIISEELKNYKDAKVALEVYNGGPKCIGRCKESVNYSRAVINHWAEDVAG